MLFHVRLTFHYDFFFLKKKLNEGEEGQSKLLLRIRSSWSLPLMLSPPLPSSCLLVNLEVLGDRCVYSECGRDFLSEHLRIVFLSYPMWEINDPCPHLLCSITSRWMFPSGLRLFIWDVSSPSFLSSYLPRGLQCVKSLLIREWK